MTSIIKNIRIEKYDIESFKKEQKPYAQILNDVIQRCPIKHSKEFHLWCFLESLPTTWKPNKYHLMEHFEISEKTYERYMSWLNAVGLIEYRQERKKDGSFGKWELIVLNGMKFNPDAVSNRSAKIDGTVISRKNKTKVIHNLDSTVPPNLGGTVKTPTTQSQSDFQEISPFRHFTVERLNDGHINTTIKNKKERKKINNAVSVFSDKLTVKNHIEMTVANRKDQDPLDDDIIDQGIYYAYKTNNDKSFDSVNKRINIFLKKVREGKWLIPQGWSGITSQAIREKEEKEQNAKREQYQDESRAFRNIHKIVTAGSGFQAFKDIIKQIGGTPCPAN